MVSLLPDSRTKVQRNSLWFLLALITQSRPWEDRYDKKRICLGTLVLAWSSARARSVPYTAHSIHPFDWLIVGFCNQKRMRWLTTINVTSWKRDSYGFGNIVPSISKGTSRFGISQKEFLAYMQTETDVFFACEGSKGWFYARCEMAWNWSEVS